MRSITYNESLKYLHQSYAKGIKVGLDGVRAILDNMGNPHDKLSVIHVAGTNGKGSTCAFLQHILMAAGFKVGMFTSPHLERYNERIRVGTQPVSDHDFARLLSFAAKTSDKTSAGDLGRLSFFELLTCMAFAYFSEQSVDIAIIETGIGGRLDSTNVIEKPLLSVITAPGYDHQELLGNTLAEIAAEEAGIIKKDCPVAVYPTPVLPIFKEKADAALYYIGEDIEITGLAYKLSGTHFSVKTAYFSYQSLSIRLLGEHQLHNAVHALLCIHALREQHKLHIPDEPVRRGLSGCQWPGRFELAWQGRCIVLDGAHNEDGARIFSQALTRYFPSRRIVLVIGISKHKDYRNILRHMLSSIGIAKGLDKADMVICTCSSFKAMPSAELAKYVKEMCEVPVLSEENHKEALKLAVKHAGTEDVIAVAGSLYLVGDCQKFLAHAKTAGIFCP